MGDLYRVTDTPLERLVTINVPPVGGTASPHKDTMKAKGAYQDFLMLRKDADTDIPILAQAKAEYARLPEGRTRFRGTRPCAAARRLTARRSRTAPSAASSAPM